MTAWTFRDAGNADVLRVVELVNHAFQVERPFKSGERTDAAQIHALLTKGRFLLMESGCGLAACVYLTPRNTHIYLGMLSVSPEQQGSGLGTRLLAEVEKQSHDLGYEALDLRFVHLRNDLHAYYTKRGFVEAGIEPAEAMQNFTVPVHFVRMSKALGR